MRAAVFMCAGCGAELRALDPDDLMWCAKCMPVCANCGATDREGGPIDLVTGECLACKGFDERVCRGQD